MSLIGSDDSVYHHADVRFSKPLRSPNLVAARKAALVAVLEAADRDFQFRFFDMAPELRNRVYHLVVAPDTTKALTHPTVPAICRASRVLRSESLPVFFGMNRFWLKIRGSSYERRAQHRVKVLRKARLEQASLRWLQHVVGENVGLLCRLLISVKSFKQAHHHRLSLTSLDLDPAVLGGFDYDTPGVWLDTNGRFWNVDGEESVAPPGLGNLLRGIVEAGDGMTKEALRKIVQCYTKAF